MEGPVEEARFGMFLFVYVLVTNLRCGFKQKLEYSIEHLGSAFLRDDELK
jgi:hypothetical protein